MELILGKTAGFCYGVNNAVTKAEDFVKNNKGKTIYCLGELVHNKQVVEKLENKGLKFVNELEEIPKNVKSAVIIRAHGESKSTYEILEKNKIEILDLTCTNVLSIHKLVEKKTKEGFYIFLVGQKTHPETIGTYSFCNKNCTVIENKEDIEEAFDNFLEKKRRKILVVAQTTFSLEKFNDLCDIVKEKVNNQNNRGTAKITRVNSQIQEIKLEVRNTICNATRLRQEETEQLSKEVDYMIVIGGKNSSNTKKLYEIAIKECKNTIWIESTDELEKKHKNELKKMRKAEKVGIMAGASTPKESIEEVMISLRKFAI